MSFASSNPFDALNDEDGWTAVTKKRSKRVKDVRDRETVSEEEETKKPSLTLDESVEKFMDSFHNGHNSADIKMAIERLVGAGLDIDTLDSDQVLKVVHEIEYTRESEKHVEEDEEEERVEEVILEEEEEEVILEEEKEDEEYEKTIADEANEERHYHSLSLKEQLNQDLSHFEFSNENYLKHWIQQISSQNINEREQFRKAFTDAGGIGRLTNKILHSNNTITSCQNSLIIDLFQHFLQGQREFHEGLLRTLIKLSEHMHNAGVVGGAGKRTKISDEIENNLTKVLNWLLKKPEDTQNKITPQKFESPTSRILTEDFNSSRSSTWKKQIMEKWDSADERAQQMNKSLNALKGQKEKLERLDPQRSSQLDQCLNIIFGDIENQMKKLKAKEKNEKHTLREMERQRQENHKQKTQRLHQIDLTKKQITREKLEFENERKRLTESLARIEKRLSQIEKKEQDLVEENNKIKNDYEPTLREYEKDIQEREEKVMQHANMQHCFNTLHEISLGVKDQILNSSSGNPIQHQMRIKLEKHYIDDLKSYMDQLRILEKGLKERYDHLHKDYDHFQDRVDNKFGVRAAHQYQELLKTIEQDMACDLDQIKQIQKELNECDASAKEIVSPKMQSYLNGNAYHTGRPTTNTIMRGDPTFTQNQSSHSTRMHAPEIIDDQNYGSSQRHSDFKRKPPRTMDNQFYSYTPPTFTQQRFYQHPQSVAPQTNPHNFDTNYGQNDYDNSYEAVENTPVNNNFDEPITFQQIDSNNNNNYEESYEEMHNQNDSAPVEHSVETEVKSIEPEVIKKEHKKKPPQKKETPKPKQHNSKPQANHDSKKRSVNTRKSVPPTRRVKSSNTGSSGWAALVGAKPDAPVTTMKVDNTQKFTKRNDSKRGRGRRSRRSRRTN